MTLLLFKNYDLPIEARYELLFTGHNPIELKDKRQINMWAYVFKWIGYISVIFHFLIFLNISTDFTNVLLDVRQQKEKKAIDTFFLFFAKVKVGGASVNFAQPKFHIIVQEMNWLAWRVTFITQQAWVTWYCILPYHSAGNASLHNKLRHITLVM